MEYPLPTNMKGDSFTLRLLFSRGGVVAAIVYFLFALLCTRLPLFNTLGYEFSALTGILVPIVAVLLTPWKSKGGSRHSDVRTFLSFLLAHVLLLLVPFSVLLINATFVKNCSILTGALFFLLIPVPAVAFCVSLTWLLRLLPRRRLFLYAIVILFLLIHPLIEILTQPQLYAYNHLFGLFIGFSWDESQPPLTTLLLFRMLTLSLTLLVFASSVIIARRRGSRRTGTESPRAWWVVAMFSFLAVVAGQIFAPSLGFRTTRGYLEDALGSHLRTEHFDIYFDSTGIGPGIIREIVEEHEFRLSQVRSALGIGWNDRIRSYIYPSRASKRRLLGTESSEIARPWMKEIHLSQSGWRSSLKHELVHVLAGSFAPYLIRAPVIRYLGLTEGLAMAVEWDWGNRTLHEYAGGLRRQRMLPGVQSFLTTGGFLNHASRLSYVACGSFCRWLIDRYGMERFLQAYSRDDMEVIGDVGELEGEWHDFLDSVPRSTPDSVAVRFLFGGEPIFRKVCARVLAELNRDAAAARSANDLDRSLDFYRRSEQLAPNARAVFGIASLHFLLGEFDSVLAVTGRYLADSLRSVSLVPLMLLRGDAAWLNGDPDEAKSCFMDLKRENLYEELTREAVVRLSILASGAKESRYRRLVTQRVADPESADSLRRVRLEELTGLVKADSGFIPAHYLLARELMSARSDTPALLSLLDLPRTVDPLSQWMTMERGNLLTRMREYERARGEFRKLLALPLPEQQRNRIRDAFERCDWLKGHTPLAYDLQ